MLDYAQPKKVVCIMILYDTKILDSQNLFLETKLHSLQDNPLFCSVDMSIMFAVYRKLGMNKRQLKCMTFQT